MTLKAQGSHISASVGQKVLLTAQDTRYVRGGCGFLICEGTFMADDFQIAAQEPYSSHMESNTTDNTRIS